MATFNKVQGFVEHLCEKEHNLGSDQLTLVLSNTAPGSESTPPTGSTAAAVIANITQISYTNLSSRNLTTSTSAQTSGTYKLVVNDLVLTASGGSVATFQHVYVVNTTSTSSKIVGYYSHSTTVTLLNGETFTFDADATNGILQLV